MIPKIGLCNHMRLLSKDSVHKATSGELPKQCHLHTNIPTYYICLHCAAPLCLNFEGMLSCLHHHFSLHPTHCFSLQIEQGSIWCLSCNDSIQNQLFDFGPQDQAEGVLKLRRFQKYINEAWKQMLGKNNVKVFGTSHRGIVNMGNTCFLSVVLQSLSACQPLRQLYEKILVKDDRLILQERIIPKEAEYFYDDMISKRENERWNVVANKKDRVRQESKKLLLNYIKNSKFNITFKDFMSQMSKKEEGPYIPTKIVSALCQFNIKYQQKQEQDAEQLLLLILDVLNEGQRISFLRDLQRYKQVEGILGFQKLTPVQSIFSFYLLNEIQCSSCKEVSRSLNLAYSIPLALGGDKEVGWEAAGRVSIDYWQELTYPQGHNCCPLLAPFFATERLCKANNYYECQKCRSLLAYRRYFLASEPKVLIVSFKRFNAKLQKKNWAIDFPWNISLQGVSLDSKHCRYSLSAVIVHEGSSIASGHYVCFVLVEGQWLLCSDEKVQVVSHNFVQSQQPYVLLYQQDA